MRQFKLLFCFLIFCVIVFSCNNITQKQFEFFYYPARNVYYDVTNNLYLYSLNGGITWDSLHATSNKEPATLGSKQIIYSTMPDIWTDNEKHVKQYNGQVINITGNDSSLSQTDLAAERKVKKPKTIVTNTDKPVEKKPGFFKRLFGKKN